MQHRKRKHPMHSRFLVIATIADGGYFNSITSNERFDIIHVAFQPVLPVDFVRSDNIYCIQQDGFKHAILYNLLMNLDSWILKEYDYIWLPDYDIDPGSEENIHRLFLAAIENQCKICQPSLSHDSYRSFEIVVNRGTGFRKTNYVEIMCPLFKASVLKDLLWTLKLTHSGWAQDAVWAKELNYDGLGIIDSVVVKHTKPVSSQYWKLPNGLNADRELELALELMGISKEQWWPKEL